MTTESQPSPAPQVPPAPTPTADPSRSGSATQIESATAPTQQTDTPSSPGIAGYGNVADLSPDEFNTPGVAKLMFYDMLRLRAELQEKAQYEKLYHDEQIRATDLQGQLNAATQVNEAKGVAANLAELCFGVFLFAAGVFATDAYAATSDKAAHTLYFITALLVGVSILAKLYASDAFKKRAPQK